MGMVITLTAGMSIWIVLWALGSRPFDGFLIAAFIVLLGGVGRIVAKHLPGAARQRD